MMAFLKLLAKPPEEDMQAAILTWAATFGQVLTWEHMSWFKSVTKLPIVLKGICHPDDARRAVDAGADAIYCSNHGGRQANGGIATIDLLEDVVKAAGDGPVLFDSGIRSGLDFMRALHLGADFVFAGRPFVYGVCALGEYGGDHAARILIDDLKNNMVQLGVANLQELREADLFQRGA